MMPEKELGKLEERIQRAFATGDSSGLYVLGYGEISSVIAWDAEGEHYACKRLPTFPNEEEVKSYTVSFEEYLSTLRQRGVQPVDSSLQTIPLQDGVAVWCIQPVLPEGSLLPKLFSTCPPEQALYLFSQVLSGIRDVVDPATGIDGQLSNWAYVKGELRYLDVTTPMMRDEDGKERLNTELFLASLPSPLRGAVRRFMLKDILDTYYDERGVVLDLLGNLEKEKLTSLLPDFLDHANARLDSPISAEEVSAYYKEDAATWSLLQKLRRADRWWQMKVRRQPYPFLLPVEIER